MKYANALLVLCALVFLAACEGPAGPAGSDGSDGPPGTHGHDGVDGGSGDDGDAGVPGRNAYLTGSGLELVIQSIALEGKTATVTFRITDGAGIPLDREGLYTAGAVTTRFVLAWLDETKSGEPLQYKAYTTSTQVSPISGESAVQADSDAEGTYTDVDPVNGVFAYELGTAIDVADGKKTHTLGAWAYRDFEGERYVANALYEFLPDGGAPSVQREVVKTSACNGCHNPLEAHGGQRREVGLCILCHQPQSSDPDTGNSVDFSVMVHKIHRGATLPSVIAGTPYEIIGYLQSVEDYSTVKYPQEIQNCEKCHTGAQGDNWRKRPSRAACGSCHDNVSFVDPAPLGMTLHAGGAQPNDKNCSVCHPQAGGLEGIATKHMTPTIDPATPVLKVAIVAVEHTDPGETPELVFSVKLDGAPVDIVATPLPRLSVTVAGPTTDYASYTTYSIQGGTPTGALAADPLGFRYVFPAAMSLAAAGSYAVAMEATIQPLGPTGPTVAAMNPVAFFAVTDSSPVDRREVVDQNLCNNCHLKLSAHGGARQNVQYCAFCHNPSNVNDERVSRFEGQSAVAHSVSLPAMIHRIHMGEALSQPYVLGGFPAPNAANPAGTPIDFGEVRYPGDRKACWACHTGSSFQLPLSAGLLPSHEQTLTCTEDPLADENQHCGTRVVSADVLSYPAATACGGCHDSPAATAHFQTTTTASGAEACATCHGPGSTLDVAIVHAPRP